MTDLLKEKLSKADLPSEEKLSKSDLPSEEKIVILKKYN